MATLPYSEDDFLIDFIRDPWPFQIVWWEPPMVQAMSSWPEARDIVRGVSSNGPEGWAR